MSKVFVTGANGFIGSRLCRHLKASGWEVSGLVRSTSNLHLLDGVEIQRVTGDLCDPSSIRIPDGVTHIVHSASIVSDVADAEVCRRNIFDLTRNFVGLIRDSAIPLRKFIYISTALTLGYGRADISEENPGLPADFIPYTGQKILAESFLLDEYARHGFPVVIMRPADVMGPGDRTTSGRLFREGERGTPLIIGSGRCRFAYTYIDNFCRAVEAALLKDGAEGRSYTVTNGALPTWREYLEAVEAGFGKKQRLYLPVWGALGVARAMELIHKLRPSYDPMLTVYRIRRATTETTYDISRTVADLGYAPDDDYRSQIVETLAWYKEERSHGHIH